MKNKLAAVIIAVSAVGSSNAYAGYGHEGKTYTKFDIGYGIQDHEQVVSGDHTGTASDSGGGFIYRAALGHYLLDELRVDFQLHFDRGLRSKQSFTSGANTVTMKGEESTFAGFFNVYYDWLNASNVTPYVNLGAGLTRNEFTSRITVDGGSESKGRKSSYGIGYKAGLGMAYHISTNVDFDIAYNYLKKGVDDYNITIPTANVTVKAEPDIAHALMFGIRLTY